MTNQVAHQCPQARRGLFRPRAPATKPIDESRLDLQGSLIQKRGRPSL